MDYYTRLIFVVLTSLHEPELENTCKNTQLCIGAVDTVLSHGHFIHLACERCATTGHPSCTASSSEANMSCMSTSQANTLFAHFERAVLALTYPKTWSSHFLFIVKGETLRDRTSSQSSKKYFRIVRLFVYCNAVAPVTRVSWTWAPVLQRIFCRCLGEEMIIPVRCFTCGKVIGNKWETYIQLLESMHECRALDELGLNRYCCRRMVLTHVDLIEKLLNYNTLDKQIDDPTGGHDWIDWPWSRGLGVLTAYGWIRRKRPRYANWPTGCENCCEHEHSLQSEWYKVKAKKVHLRYYVKTKLNTKLNYGSYLSSTSYFTSQLLKLSYPSLLFSQCIHLYHQF